MNVATESPDVICPYCHGTAELVTGEEVYPKFPALKEKLFYRCKPCGAYVGTHGDGRPLGTLANAPLRKARLATHAAFDRLWRTGLMSRPQCYRWMQEVLDITPDLAHIAMLNEDQCRKLREASAKMLNHLNTTRASRPKPPRR